ncbi:MAG: hypothetical protein ACSLE5_06110 [Porticoccaceae bacterium]
MPEEIDTLVQVVYEEMVEVPESLQARLEKSLQDGEGKNLFPQDSSKQSHYWLP